MSFDMVKVIAPGSYRWDAAQAKLIKLAHAGLRGEDLRALVKRAGHEFADALQRVKLASGEVPIHLLAIGATEYYGPNRNGDGFADAVCREYHPTFVKYARWYRNHANKNPERSYGVIKYSSYNQAMHRIELLVALNGTKEAAHRNGGLVADEELEKLANGDDIAVSMACSKAGTLIYTDKGFKPIEFVEPGDLVLTHLGRFRPAGNRSTRPASEIVKIGLRYYGRQTLEFTPNHEFYVARWEDMPKGSYPESFPSRPFRTRYRDQLHTVARWLPCGDLKPGDILLVPIRQGRNSPGICQEEARLLGYYVAEGSLIDNTTQGVRFTCHRHDVLVTEINSLIRPHVTVTQRDHSGSEHAVSIEVYSRELFEICAKGAGRRIANKRIPLSIWNATAELKLHFLATWFNGDGWQDVKGLHWNTCSRSLSLELQNLLASVGMPASVSRIDHPGDLPEAMQRPSAGTRYTVNVSNRYSEVFAGKSKAVIREAAAVKTTVFITGSYLAVPIGSVERVREDCTVYNFSVTEDETYTAFGLATHNCRVPFDICSGCDNKARNRVEYCRGVDQGGHCKMGGLHDRITLVDDNGDQLYARNTEPTFFDISKVFRPADRIAWVTGQLKAASAACLSGVQLAEAWQVTAPAYLSDDPRVQRWSKLAAHLADIERRVEVDGLGYHGLAWTPSVQSELPWDDHGVKPAEALAALQHHRVCPPLAGYVKMAGVAHADAVAVQAQHYLPGIYGRMLNDGTFTSVDLSGFAGSDGVPSLRARTWAEKRAADYGVSAEDVRRRTVRASLHGEGVPSLRQPTAVKVAGAAYDVARNYALFKLALLDRMARDADFGGACGMAVRQNYV